MARRVVAFDTSKRTMAESNQRTAELASRFNREVKPIRETPLHPLREQLAALLRNRREGQQGEKRINLSPDGAVKQQRALNLVKALGEGKQRGLSLSEIIKRSAKKK